MHSCQNCGKSGALSHVGAVGLTEGHLLCRRLDTDPGTTQLNGTHTDHRIQVPSTP